MVVALQLLFGLVHTIHTHMHTRAHNNIYIILSAGHLFSFMIGVALQLWAGVLHQRCAVVDPLQPGVFLPSPTDDDRYVLCYWLRNWQWADFTNKAPLNRGLLFVPLIAKPIFLFFCKKITLCNVFFAVPLLSGVLLVKYMIHNVSCWVRLVCTYACSKNSMHHAVCTYQIRTC